MKIEKYTATGNSFVIFDIINKKLTDAEKEKLVLTYCKDRDGGIFVEKHNEKFFMDYFNNDGKRATFCGNGARTFLYYIKKSGYVDDETVYFETYAGTITGKLTPTGVMIKMPEPSNYKLIEINNYKGFLITVGVPHFVTIVKNVEEIDVNKIGKLLRNKLNANVNFVEIIKNNFLKIRTFERGVERETLACGSGSTASAYVLNKSKLKKIYIQTKGGVLIVHFLNNHLYLEGGVENV
ncbi:MAG: diaminopimelate epimerase [Thermosipho sp. (in: Bacteria)]|nr:diaminopimelate epimerase [Thermosipho sp. (in: thermotogales)]